MGIPTGLIEGIERLEPLPVTVRRLLSALEAGDVSVVEVADVVQYDPAIAASVLRRANSAALGGWSTIVSLRDAVVRLGVTRILDVALTEYLRRWKGDAPLYDLAEDDLWEHATAASLAVQAIVRERPRAGVPESASVAALVHDIGKLIMVRYMKADVSAILRIVERERLSFVEAEHALFGCDHAEVGGAIARHWGLPVDVLDAVERHHEVPVTDPTPSLDAVMVANLAAKAVGTGLGAEGMNLRIDDGCYRRLGLDFDGFSRVCLQTMTWLEAVKRGEDIGVRQH